MTTTAWPEGVIARYVTVGGATVNLSRMTDSTSHTATCGGCTHTQTFTSAGFGGFYTEEGAAQQILQDTRRWAQSHADTCRAMPRPDSEERS